MLDVGRHAWSDVLEQEEFKSEQNSEEPCIPTTQLKRRPIPSADMTPKCFAGYTPALLPEVHLDPLFLFKDFA